MKRYIYIYLFAIISFGVTTPTLASFSPPKNVIIMIGEVKGIMDSQNATGPSGLLITN